MSAACLSSTKVEDTWPGFFCFMGSPRICSTTTYCIVTGTTFYFPHLCKLSLFCFFLFLFFLHSVCSNQPARRVNMRAPSCEGIALAKTYRVTLACEIQICAESGTKWIVFIMTDVYLVVLCRFFRKGVPGCEEDSVLWAPGVMMQTYHLCGRTFGTMEI